MRSIFFNKKWHTLVLLLLVFFGSSCSRIFEDDPSSFMGELDDWNIFGGTFGNNSSMMHSVFWLLWFASVVSFFYGYLGSRWGIRPQTEYFQVDNKWHSVSWTESVTPHSHSDSMDIAYSVFGFFFVIALSLFIHGAIIYWLTSMFGVVNLLFELIIFIISIILGIAFFQMPLIRKISRIMLKLYWGGMVCFIIWFIWEMGEALK